MSEFIKVADGLPADGQIVEIKLMDGRKVKPVEYSAGRFWKVRKERGGHEWISVEAWREIAAPKRSAPNETPA